MLLWEEAGETLDDVGDTDAAKDEGEVDVKVRYDDTPGAATPKIGSEFLPPSAVELGDPACAERAEDGDDDEEDCGFVCLSLLSTDPSDIARLMGGMSTAAMCSLSGPLDTDLDLCRPKANESSSSIVTLLIADVLLLENLGYDRVSGVARGSSRV